MTLLPEQIESIKLAPTEVGISHLVEVLCDEAAAAELKVDVAVALLYIAWGEPKEAD
jgi:hypothetical protein